MPLLTGDIQSRIFKAFKGKLLAGQIRREVVGESAGLDDNGDPIDVGWSALACQGFTQNYSDYFIMTSGIETTDLQVCIFGGSIPGFTPSKDDQVWFKGIAGIAWYQLRGPVKTDPATALWVCQAFPIPQPEDA